MRLLSRKGDHLSTFSQEYLSSHLFYLYYYSASVPCKRPVGLVLSMLEKQYATRLGR